MLTSLSENAAYGRLVSPFFDIYDPLYTMKTTQEKEGRNLFIQMHRKQDMDSFES
jgi:hypothetical protein